VRDIHTFAITPSDAELFAATVSALALLLLVKSTEYKGIPAAGEVITRSAVTMLTDSRTLRRSLKIHPNEDTAENDVVAHGSIDQDVTAAILGAENRRGTASVAKGFIRAVRDQGTDVNIE